MNPNLAEAYFSSGVASEAMGHKEAAAENFKVILSITKVEPQTRKAAMTRTEQLGFKPLLEKLPTAAPLKVLLYFTDEHDHRTVMELRKALETRKLDVRATELNKAPGRSKVYYFSRQAAEEAQRVKTATEEALAGQGFNIKLETVYRDNPKE